MANPAGANQVGGDAPCFTTELIDKFRIPEMVKISGLESRSRYTFVAAAAIIVVGSVQRLMRSPPKEEFEAIFAAVICGGCLRRSDGQLF